MKSRNTTILGTDPFTTPLLGKEARREFHDAQHLRDRTGAELKQDAKAIYDENYEKTGKTCPRWMSP
jgi:hypothetical protein